MEKIHDKVVSWARHIEPQAAEQARRVAMLEFVSPHVALMPDVHWGMGATIGSVIPTTGAVIPAAVGVDIGCGMSAVRLVHPASSFERLSVLRESLMAAIPLADRLGNTHITSSAQQHIDRLSALPAAPTTDLGRWQHQLGSLGGGNHFLEIAADEEGMTWLTLHSGSRGVGNYTAQQYIKQARARAKAQRVALPDPDLAYFVQGDGLYESYLTDLDWLQQYAKANRDEMMTRMLVAVRNHVGSELDITTAFDCHHNYAVMESHAGRDLLITRKGAIRARIGDVGLVPGSMGTPSYVVMGKGEAASYCSAPHGAGRRMSRRQAKAEFDLAALVSQVVGVETELTEALLDEAPGAYKDIGTVIAESAPLVEIRHTLTPILNIKG